MGRVVVFPERNIPEQRTARAAFDLFARTYGHRHGRAVERGGGGQLPSVHSCLHRGLFRYRRHRLDQDRASLRQRHGAAAMERPEGCELHHDRGLERRGSRLALRSETQHSAVGQDADDPCHARLSARGRHDHRPLWRSPAGFSRHARPDVRRTHLRVPRAGRRLRHLQLRRTAGAADGLGRRRTAGNLEGCVADLAPLRRGFSPGLQR